MRTKVSTKGQVVIPGPFRAQDAIVEGDELEVTRVKAGEYRLVRVAPRRAGGLVDWLVACPAPGYFTAIPSESTDDL